DSGAAHHVPGSVAYRAHRWPRENSRVEAAGDCLLAFGNRRIAQRNHTSSIGRSKSTTCDIGIINRGERDAVWRATLERGDVGELPVGSITTRPNTDTPEEPSLTR